MKAERNILGSLRRLCRTGLEVAQVRLELFSLEMREEKLRLVEAFLLAALAAALGIVALSLLTLSVLMLVSERMRPVALLGLALLYLAGAAGIWWRLRARLRAEVPFEGSISELEKDRQCLGNIH